MRSKDTKIAVVKLPRLKLFLSCLFSRPLSSRSQTNPLKAQRPRPPLEGALTTRGDSNGRARHNTKRLRVHNLGTDGTSFAQDPADSNSNDNTVLCSRCLPLACLLRLLLTNLIRFWIFPIKKSSFFLHTLKWILVFRPPLGPGGV